MNSVLPSRFELSPRRWMLLPVQHKVRELDGNALLAFEAAERGWGVIVGTKLIRNRSDLPRGILIEKGIAPGKSAKLAAVNSIGRRLAAWCEEGLVYASGEEYGRYKIDLKSYNMLDAFFAWGRNQAADVRSALGLESRKLIITGNPRFDLHRPELRAIFEERVSAIRHSYGRFILVNTKFSRYNGHADQSAALNKLKTSGKVRTRKQEQDAEDLIAFHKAGYLSFVALVGDLSRTFPERTIVIRPHPAERMDTWKEETKTFPNVRVVRSGNVAEWILAADACVHSNCTTGVESYLLGRPAVSYRPVSDPRFDLFLPNALSVNTFTPDDTLDLVAASVRGQRISNEEDKAKQAELAGCYIANVDGERASQRIVDALDAVGLAAEPLSFVTTPATNLKLAAKHVYARVRGALDARRRIKSPARDSIATHEMLDRLLTMQRIGGRYGGVQVRILEKDVFCVH